jgi:acetylornithine/succinyldiaminopimelate/putrescine aminotransferase
LERAIEAANGEAAAFIFEPVSGATLGAVVPPPGYPQKIAEVCQRHGVLLIADEVMTGMGRTGRNFAVDHFADERGGVAPDILIAAKGLSSGYAPLGAVIATRKVVDGIASGAFLHGFTYNAHPVSLAAGRAVLHYLQHGTGAGSRLRDWSHRRRDVGAVALDPARFEDRGRRGVGLLRGGVRVGRAEQAALRPTVKFRPARDCSSSEADCWFIPSGVRGRCRVETT